jgi:hypothetical protein
LVPDFVAGLGRAAYACGALEFDRPFLAPMYTFASLHGLDTHQALPLYVLLVVKFLHDRLKVRRMYKCSQAIVKMTEAIRVDAKAEGETATIGGWLPTRNARGEIDLALSPWFFVALNEQVAPWAYARDRQPFRVVASLEALAVLVAVLTLTDADPEAANRGTVLLPMLTDNRGNSFSLSRLMTTKFPLSVVGMELATALEERNLTLNADWVPREWNAQADDLTNSRFDEFSPGLRRVFDLKANSFKVFNELIVAGAAFHEGANAARIAVRDRVVPRGGGVRRGRRATLKERDPW